MDGIWERPSNQSKLSGVYNKWWGEKKCLPLKVTAPEIPDKHLLMDKKRAVAMTDI
jgi:hypothetical protein